MSGISRIDFSFESSITVLVNSGNEIVYQLPMGKPDPTIPCTKENFYTRPRIEQTPQEGLTCEYYAALALINPTGDRPNPEFLEDSEIQQRISDHTKKISIVSVSYELNQDILANFPGSELWKKEKAVTYLSDMRDRIHDSGLMSEQITRLEYFGQLLQAFVACPDNITLQEFVEKDLWSQRNAINNAFMKAMRFDPQEAWRRENAMVPNTPALDALKEDHRYGALCALSFRAAFQAYRMRVSTWHPQESPARLVEVLRLNGPMLVKGNYGKPYYGVEPFEVEKIAGQAILGWKNTDLRIENKYRHAVVIVGARVGSGGKGFVYYEDRGTNGSNPDHPEDRKIYVMTYASFIERIIALNGYFPLKVEGVPPAVEQLVRKAIFEPYARSVGYGLHAPLTTKIQSH